MISQLWAWHFIFVKQFFALNLILFACWYIKFFFNLARKRSFPVGRRYSMRQKTAMCRIDPSTQASHSLAVSNVWDYRAVERYRICTVTVQPLRSAVLNWKRSLRVFISSLFCLRRMSIRFYECHLHLSPILIVISLTKLDPSIFPFMTVFLRNKYCTNFVTWLPYRGEMNGMRHDF